MRGLLSFVLAIMFSFCLALYANSQELEIAEFEQGELLIAKWLGHRSTLDKSACIATITVFGEFAPDQQSNPFYREIEIRSAISFRQRLFRCESVAKDKIDVRNEGYAILRYLKNSDGEFRQLERETPQLNQIASSGNLFKMTPENKKSISYWAIDPYLLIGGTLFGSYESSFAQDYLNGIEERGVINVSRGYEREMAFFTDPRSGNFVLRKYQDDRFSREIVFDKETELPIAIRDLIGLKREVVFSKALIASNAVTASGHKITWQPIGTGENAILMPKELTAIHSRGLRPKQRPAQTDEITVVFNNWWLGKDVPDSIFTLEDLGNSDIGLSVFVQLLDSNKTGKSPSW